MSSPRILRVTCAALLALAACDSPPMPLDASVDAYVDPSIVSVRFDPDGEGFFDTPWPSDARLTAAGTPDMGRFGGRRGPVVRSLEEIEENVFGFATMPVVYVALNNDVDEASIPSGLDALAPDATVQMIDLSESDCGQRVPTEVSFAPVGDDYRDDHMLQVANAVGAVLTPGHPYGLIVLRSFGASESRSTPRPAAFDRALADASGGDALSRSLEPLRRCLPGAGVALDDVAVATVFTPQDPVEQTQRLRDFVVDPSRVETRPVLGWRRSEAWSRRRLELETFIGQVELPIVQDGETPYESRGGRIVFDEAGEPVIQRWEAVDVAIAVGVLEESFEGPRPVLVFTDGTGWTPWGHLPDNWVREALAAGYVVMSFMPQFHGERAGVTGNVELLTFNVPNPAAVRSNFRQQAMETSYFVRVIREQLSGQPGLPPLDTERLVYGGHSQGALVGAVTAAVEDQYLGYVFNGLSSYLTQTILFREDIVDFAAVVSGLYAYGGTLDRFSPLLQMMQLGGEVVDPHNYVARWHGSPAVPSGNHVFVSNGLMDATTTPRGMEHMTMSADMPPIAPAGWDVDPVGVWDGEPVALPVRGNEVASDGSPLTLATYLDAEQGHGTIYRRPFVRELAIRFWDTARGGLPELSSQREYQCGDGADEDQDGMTDCADEDCADSAPCSEERCDDELDDDGNGLVDCADPACADDSVCGERMCGDSVDNDGDGATDCADSDCERRAPCAEGSCTDGEDGDGDGDIDCADSDCASALDCRERFCGNNTDDDGDGALDCADSDCIRSPLCPESVCDDGLDSDDNGRIDCDDPDCALAPECGRPAEDCDNNTDDDGDGLVGCEDADCARHATCAATTCADGNLGSQTGVALVIGTLRGASNDYPPGDCISLGRGEDTPDLSYAWTAPAAGDYLISTLGSSVDTVLSVLEASCDPVAELACDDDEGPVSSSSLTVTLEEGQTVVIVVGAYDAEEDAGAFLLHVLPAS